MCFFFIQSNHFTRFPSSHSPFLLTFVDVQYSPKPCYFPNFQLPAYFLPSPHSYVPNPCFISFKCSPSYFLPSLQVNRPFPFILFRLQFPLYSLLSGQCFFFYKKNFVLIIHILHNHVCHCYQNNLYTKNHLRKRFNLHHVFVHLYIILHIVIHQAKSLYLYHFIYHLTIHLHT